ncbi:MAG: TonB-dependent receptor domain-containing protein [Candidatus Methylacidiphilales bacterium]
MKIKLFYLVCLFTLVNTLMAQNFPNKAAGTNGAATILATFIDLKTNKPVEYATVSLVRVSDSAIVNGTTTTKKGEIKLENIAFGAYKLKASFIGYKTLIGNVFVVTPKELVVDLGIFKMEASAKNLKTVEVTGERSDFTNQLDKKTYNVGKNITNIGGSATDILQNIPSVNVDIDGKISLRGSENVTILIDGKPSTLTGANRQAILQQLPANAISEVEIITNPSAKYDADGMAGIINIKTKKDKLKGFNANTQATVGTNDKYSFNIGLNNRTSKYNLFGNYSFRHERRDNFGNGEQFNRFVGNSFSFKNSSNGYNLNDFHTGRVGMDYYINNYNTVSFSTGISSNVSGKPDFINFDYFDSVGTQFANFKRNNYSTDDNLTIDATVDYKRTARKNKSELTASASINSNARNANENFESILAGGTEMNLQRNKNTATFTNFIAQIDYVLPLKNGKIETGAKTTTRIIDNNQQGFRYNFGNNEFWEDSLISNHFVYNEMVNAAYVTFASRFKKFDYQVGVRTEIANIEGNSKTTNTIFTNDYYNFFPSGFIKYGLAKNQDLQLGYSRRINRPGFESLNPFVDYSDSVNLRQGNPKIQPEYIHSVELNYQTQIKKLNFSATLYYRYTDNMIARFRNLDSKTGQFITSFYNFNSAENTGFEFIFRYSFVKLGNLMLSGNWYRNVVNGGNVQSDLQSEITTWNTRLTYNLPLPKAFYFQANGMYMAPMRFAQNTISGMNGLDIGLRKDFMAGKLQCGLNLSDVFDIRQFNIRQDGDNFTYQGMRKRETRILTFSLTYRFGSNENPFTKKKPSSVPVENMDMGF